MDSLWQHRIPHIRYYAFKELIAVKEKDKSKYVDMARSFKWIHQMLNLYKKTQEKYVQPEKVEELIDNLETSSEQDKEGEKTYQYLAKRIGFGYRKLHVQCIIEPDGSAKVFRDVEIEAFSSVSEFDTFIILPEENKETSSKDIEPGNIKSGDSHSLSLSVIKQEPGRMIAKIQISPPLKTGEWLKYRIFDFFLPPKLYAINISSEDYEKREVQIDYFGWHINRPTKEFILEVQFPSGSSPSDYHLQVRYAASAGVPTEEVPDQEQRKLLKPELHYVEDRVVMVSKIDYPLHGLIYMLGWLPKLKDD